MNGSNVRRHSLTRRALADLEARIKDSPLLDGEEAIVTRLAAEMRVERSSPYEIAVPMARQRSEWIEANIPRHRQLAIWDAVRLRIESEDAKAKP